jgi:ClpP class serine protease
MYELWAVDPSFIPTLQKLESATTEQITEANAMFGGQDLPTILAIEGEEAVIEITGAMTKNGPSPIARFFGVKGTSYLAILESIDVIMADPNIKRVIVKADSPGGIVNGLDVTFQAFMRLRKQKTVIFENHGLMASAMYYLAASGTKIKATSPDAETGSVGVVIAGISFKKADEKWGIIEYKIVSSNAPNKMPDPLTKKGAGVLQERVDALERVFMQRISEGRGIPVEKIKKDFGQGAILIAKDPDKSKTDAISVGMIDGLVDGVKISEFEEDTGAEAGHEDDTHTGDDTLAVDGLSGTDHVVDNNKPKIKETKTMALKELMAEDAALAAEVTARDKENVAAGRKEGAEVVEARVAAAAPYLSDTKYPKAIHTLAAEVAAGKQEVSALVGAVTVLDAQGEQAASAAAAEEQGDQEETPAGGTEDGSEAKANYEGKKQRLSALGV